MFDVIPSHRRRGARRIFRTRCQAVRMNDFKLIGERVLDLSPRGMLVACDEQMKLGDEVLASFRAPWLGPDIVVIGEVARIVEGWRLGDPGYCAGVRFLDVEPEYSAELSERLRHLPVVPGARRHPVDYAGSVRAISMGCC